MFPLRDINPTRRLPIFTYGLIAANVLVFLWQQTLTQPELQDTFLTLSVVPALLSRDPLAAESLLDVVRSMFFHGGWAHLLGNMLYLWLFGDNIEDRFGIVLYTVLYFLSGFTAAFVQVYISPQSPIPLVGASGAIAGVLGSYLILYPGVRVQGVIFLGWFSQLTELPAAIVLGLWFVLQLFNGVASLGVNTMTGGVAFFAHIGGFVAGVAITWIFMRLVPQPPLEERRDVLYDRVRRSRW